MSWQQRMFALKFRIGDLTLFSMGMPMQMRAVQLTEAVDASDSPQPPSEPALGSAVGYMIRSLPVSQPLPVLTLDGGFIRYVTLQYMHCYIDLRIGLEAYKAKFSAKTRSTIQRKVRKFQESCGGNLRWLTFAKPDEMSEFHRLARVVSALTYQERLLDAGIPGSAAFIGEMIERAAADRVRGYILFDGERPVSYLYCPIEENTLIYAYLGYDPAYMKHSVGTVLQWLALEQLFEEGHFDLFDFTEGQSDHKRLFATHESRRANVLFVRYAWWRWMLLRSHAAMDALSNSVGRLAERWGIKSTLRKALRFGWAGSR